jgi:hypothetical protein
MLGARGFRPHLLDDLRYQQSVCDDRHRGRIPLFSHAQLPHGSSVKNQPKQLSSIRNAYTTRQRVSVGGGRIRLHHTGQAIAPNVQRYIDDDLSTSQISEIGAASLPAPFEVTRLSLSFDDVRGVMTSGRASARQQLDQVFDKF